MRVRHIGILAAALCVPLGAQVRREGSYWVEAVAGSVPLAPGSRFKVVSTGTLLVQGMDVPAATYSVKKQVRARSETEARRLLAEYTVRTKTAGEWTYLVVTPPSERGNMGAEITLKVPRRLPQAAFETNGGNVEAYDLDGDVDAETRGGRIQMDRIGGAAGARTGGGDVVLGKVGGRVKCLSGGGAIRVAAAGGESWFETAGGEIWVGEAVGPVRASTNGGNIHIDRAGASVDAHTSGGLIEIGRAGGLVIAESSGGSIAVGSARGVRCESAAGAIKLRNVSGGLRASTASGHILAEIVPGLPIEESFLTTGAGDVTVLIPASLALTVRAINQSGGSGRIVSDFPGIRTAQEARRGRQAVAEGELNGGGPVLRITVVNGSIYLRRAK